MTRGIRTTIRADGAVVYTTAEGDILDHICWRYYGRESGPTELVLDANRGLGALGPVLPAGVKIVLPVIEAPTAPTIARIDLFA